MLMSLNFQLGLAAGRIGGTGGAISGARLKLAILGERSHI